MKRSKNYIGKLYKYLSISQQILVIVLIIATTGLGMLVPMILKDIIDVVFTKQQYDKMPYYGLCLLTVTLLLAVFEFYQNYVISKLSESITQKIRKEIYDKALNLDSETLKKYTSSNIVSLFNNDIAQVNSLIISFTTRFVVQVMTLIVILAVLIYIDIKLTVLSIFTVPIYFILFYFLKNKLQGYAKKRQELYVGLNKNLQEDIQGIEIIQTLKVSEVKKKKFNKILTSMNFNNVKLAKISAALGETASLVAGLADVVVFWLGAIMVQKGNLTLGSVFAFSVYIGRLYAPILSLISINQTFQIALPSLERVYTFLSKESMIQDEPGAIELHKPITRISLKDIVVNYDGNKRNAVDKVNIEIEKGKVIGIIGESGSGKSSISRLLVRLLEPTSGDIQINNNTYKKYKVDSIREHIGIVPQNAMLFTGSIDDNIIFEMNDVKDSEVREAIETASADFIDKLSNKGNSQLGESGFNISGGEKQRITLARTLLRNYDVLILDEATSSVDNKIRKEIIKRLMSKYKDKALVMITHKLEDVREADMLYIMKDGKIKGCGTHEELLRNNDYYKELCNMNDN